MNGTYECQRKEVVAVRKYVVGSAIALGLALWLPGSWAQRPTEDLRNALYRLYQPSQIELANPGRRGAVHRLGKLLVLAVDGVPAKPFRVIQASPKSPRFTSWTSRGSTWLPTVASRRSPVR